jgi:hypothetical protein
MPISVIPVTGLVLGPIGSISQTDFPLVSPRQVNPTDTNNLAFGETFVLNSNNTYSSVKQYIASNSAAALTTLLNLAQPSFALGIAKDAVESNAYYPLQGGTTMPAGYYAPGMVVNGLTRGTISVQVNNGTPVGANSPVYLRTATDGAIPAGVVGGIEAVQDPNATVVGTANTGNTGNGTIGTLSLKQYGLNGTYTVVFSAATAFSVYDPYGKLVGTGATGTAFNVGSQIQFTITAGGTAFAKGDGFSIVVTSKTIVIPNIVFKTGVLSTDPNTGVAAAQVTILERKVA